jgi:HlyD family secretion protein
LPRSLGLILLGLALGALATWAFQAGFHSPSTQIATGLDNTSDAAAQHNTVKDAVHALGTLEPAGGAVLVSSPLAGTPVKEIMVHEGQIVAAGQNLIQLDDTMLSEELQLVQAQRQQAVERQQSEIALARQRVEAAALGLEQAQGAQSAQADAQQKQVELAKTKSDQAQDDLRRLQQLDGGGRPLVSAQQVEHQQTLVRLASVEYSAAKSSLDQLVQTLKFNLQKAQTEKKAADEALDIASRGTAVSALDRQIKLAELKLAQATVSAPSEGTVISILAHPGELVSTQPLVQLANLKALECLAEVDVADLPLLKGKRDARISARAFHGTKINATIERVRNVAGAATLRPADPRKPIDRTVATVVLKVDSHEAAKLLGDGLLDATTALMGLQVDVEIPL